jgi:hypothetical protein
MRMMRRADRIPRCATSFSSAQRCCSWRQSAYACASEAKARRSGRAVDPHEQAVRSSARNVPSQLRVLTGCRVGSVQKTDRQPERTEPLLSELWSIFPETIGPRNSGTSTRLYPTTKGKTTSRTCTSSSVPVQVAGTSLARYAPQCLMATMSSIGSVSKTSVPGVRSRGTR